MLWRDLDCAPHPGQKVGCRLSTVTVQACSRRSTLTTFKPAAGDHVIDVFIAPCCRIPSQGASRPAHHRERRTRRRLHQELIRPHLSANRHQAVGSPLGEPFPPGRAVLPPLALPLATFDIMQAYRGLRRGFRAEPHAVETVLDKAITYVGLDVHKDTIAVALAEAGLRGDVREYGKIANTPAAVKALAAKLSRDGSPYLMRTCSLAWYLARPSLRLRYFCRDLEPCRDGAEVLAKWSQPISSV